MLIAIEGIDGAGKGTQADLLKTRAQENGIDAVVISFPRYGHTLFSESVADYLNGKFSNGTPIDPHLSSLLFAGDRFESRSFVLHTLQSHDLVLLDRFVSSNLAYHAAQVSIKERKDFINWLAQVEYGVYGLPEADLTVYLDVPAETAYKLILQKQQRSYTLAQTDIYEMDVPYLAACREVYGILERQNYRSKWHSIQCTHSNGQMRKASEICNSIWGQIAPALENIAPM